jgi:hypothetical protein
VTVNGPSGTVAPSVGLVIVTSSDVPPGSGVVVPPAPATSASAPTSAAKPTILLALVPYPLLTAA